MRILKHGDKAKVTRHTDRSGRVTSVQIETPDGRQAAVVRPATIRQQVSVGTGEVTRKET